MTKHFEWAAAYVRRIHPTVNSIADAERERGIEDAFIALFREFDPRFDVDRFRAACRGGVRA